MESPFFKINNLEGLRESKDMKWDDGWELISRGFGLTEQNTYTTDAVPNVYLILYNKYTGILRVLLKVCRGADYNAARITLSFNSNTQLKTDLLEISRGEVSALDKKFTTTSYAVGSKYFNDNTLWFYGDFPMMYDPCTCIFKSKLSIISELIANSQIAIEGGITGDIYTKDVGGKAQIQKPGSFGWKDFSGIVKGKVNTAYENIKDFTKEAQNAASNPKNSDTTSKISSINSLANILANNKFLKAGLNAVPFLKSAVSVWDIFIGGGKTTAEPQEVKLLPLAVNLTVKLDGTISTVNPYHNIIFTNPGSKDAQLDPAAYPYYNEVLGVFNLIKAPVIFRKSVIGGTCSGPGGGSNYTKRTFRFDIDSFYYVLNPAAELSIQNMKAAIIASARPLCSPCGVTPDTTNMAGKQLNSSFPFFEGKDALTNRYNFRTDYFDMKCLDQQILTYYPVGYQQNCGGAGGSQWQMSDQLYLKIMLNLKRNNATPTTQNILLVLTYPLKTVNDAVQATTPSNVICDSLIVSPATNSFINTFCQSIAYNNIDRQSRPYKDSILAEQKIESRAIGVFPNPNTGTFTIRIKKQNSFLTSLYITDITGRRVFVFKESRIDLSSYDLNRIFSIYLKSGIYILTAITTKRQLKTKFIVSHESN
jgi:hypothetical protein